MVSNQYFIFLSMQHFKTITEYSNAIGILPPKHPHFDIRSFEENMGSMVSHMPSFRHEFYYIAIRTYGEGKVRSGHNTKLPEGVTIYFNTPFQIQSWDIDTSWTGYYIIFSQDFLSTSHYFDRFLDDFPFLKIDESVPFNIDKIDQPEILNIYNRIKQEFVSEREDKFDFISIYVIQLLTQIKRLYSQHVGDKMLKEQIRKADLQLLSRFQKLVKTSFYPEAELDASANIHSPSYYASILNVHPNHLNAVVKSITGHTTLYHIHNHIIIQAKAELTQTNFSVKEIAYRLRFDSPSHFGSFFKKYTGMTPLSYRKNN